LQRKNQEFRTVNKEMTNFAFIASHDLREPLRKIRRFTQELIEREVQVMTEMGKAYARKIQDSVTRMNALIDDIRAFSGAPQARG
jgi:light-regulated signal transduction histidine kinase (bacteriophytochrome)